MGRYDGTMVGIRRRRFGSDDGVAVMGGASRRMWQYGISDTYHIIWYNITIWYGNIAILYGKQLTITTSGPDDSTIN